MEYVFETKGDIEILKTKGSAHSNLEGFHLLEQKYPDQIVIDRFCIVKKFDSKEDSAGNCYDWYEIKDHYRNIDYFTPVKNEVIPYTETKTAYIGDTEVTFDNKEGNLTVFFPHKYTVERLSDRIIISFDELEEVTEITISIL